MFRKLMGTNMLPKNIAFTDHGTVQGDIYNGGEIAIQLLDHTQPINSPNLSTSPAHLGPDVGAIGGFTAVNIFRRPALIATGLCTCTSCTLCASKFSVLKRQS